MFLCCQSSYCLQHEERPSIHSKGLRAYLPKSSVIYEFTCQCDSGYVGRTTQRLGDRIKQHVPSNIRNKTGKTSDSAIGQHLLDNPDCAKLYNDDMFQIIGRARSSFHLAFLESIYIQTKKPSLCRQKEFVFSLGLQW